MVKKVCQSIKIWVELLKMVEPFAELLGLTRQGYIERCIRKQYLRDRIMLEKRIMLENGFKQKDSTKEKKCCEACGNEIQSKVQKYCSQECSRKNKTINFT